MCLNASCSVARARVCVSACGATIFSASLESIAVDTNQRPAIPERDMVVCSSRIANMLGIDRNRNDNNW